MSVDTLKQLGTSICKEYLGFQPTSNALKPPHVANGLFRNCVGETCNSKDVHEWIISERKKNAISSEEIIEKYKDILSRNNKTDPKTIRQIRYLFEEVFDQDNSAYPSYEFSVYNISSHWLLKKKVNAELDIGEFLFEILSKIIEGKRSLAIELIQQALKNDDDDLTKIIKPIITFPSEKEKREVNGIDYPNDSDIRWNDCKQTIREGFDKLATNIICRGENKNPLLVLERMVNYAGFSVFLYLINSDVNSFTSKNVPIMIDGGGSFESIKKASEQTYTLAKKSVEDYFVSALKQILSNEMIDINESKCKKWIDSMVFDSSDKEEDIKNAINSYFESYLSDDYDPLESLARSLQIALYTFVYKSSSPSDFCRVLGVRNGIIGPKGNRANVKRYLTSTFTLETLALSVLSSDEFDIGIEFKDFSKYMIEKYNILFGCDPDSEYKILQDSNVAQSTPGDLRGDMPENASMIADTFISLGIAKRYADGVTLIGWRL